MVLKKQKNDVDESRLRDYMDDSDDNDLLYIEEQLSIENKDFEEMCHTEERYQIITEITSKLTEYIKYQMLPFGDLLGADDIELFLKKLN